MAEADEEGDLFLKLQGWYKADAEKFKLWWGGDDTAEGAEVAFRFRDGDQWDDKEREALEGQNRPVLVFNRTGVLVDAVVGAEIGNRREVRFISREMSDAKPNELLTSAAEWFRDQCDAEDEESEAFKDTVTAGMGWTETRLDFSENPDGEPKIEHFSPAEARWDANATKANLVDTERRWRVRKMDVASAKALLPGVDEEELNASWADESDEEADPIHVEEGNRYSGRNGSPDVSPRRKVTVVACQYFKKEAYYRTLLMTPDGQMQQVEIDEHKHAMATEMGVVVKSVKLSRKVVMQCFIGKTSIIKKPQKTQTGTWTWNCITGLKDQKRGTFYGIVRRAIDPQRWANKWLSQMMHILNSQAKGGIMAEEGVFEDQREAEQNWAKPNGITMLAKGTLSNPNGAKLQNKPVASFPAGFDRLLQYADEAIIKATGINMELLGMRDAVQAGILEYQRKQSGVAILASFFDSLRRYRKIQGRAMLYLIQNFLSDGRMVRIVGEEETKYVPLTKQATSEYDVIVDDAPTSTNEKEKTWQLLQGILPMFGKNLTPDIMMVLAEYSPLPSSLVEKLQEKMGGGEQQMIPPEVQQAIQQLTAENEQLKQDQSAERMKIEGQLQLQREKQAGDFELAKEKAHQDRQIALLQSGAPVVEMRGEDGDTEIVTETVAAHAQSMEALAMIAQSLAGVAGSLKQLGQLVVQDGQATRAAVNEQTSIALAPVGFVRDADGRVIGAQKLVN